MMVHISGCYLGVWLALIVGFTSATTSQAADSDSQQALPKSRVETSTEHALQRFFDQVFERDLERSPIQAAFMGESINQDQWDDISPAFQAHTMALMQSDIEAVNAFDDTALSPAARLSKRIFLHDRKSQMAWHSFRDEHYLVEPLWGAQLAIPSVLMGAHPVHSVPDAESYIRRLRHVPLYLDEVVRQLDERAGKGFYLVDWMYPQIINASAAIITGFPFDDLTVSAPIWADIERKIEQLAVSRSEKDRLLDAVEAGLLEHFAPAYRRLIGALERQQPHASRMDSVARFPRGAQYYQMLLNHYTSTTLSAQDIHTLGLENVARLHSEMIALMTELGFEGSLTSFFHHVRTDDSLHFADSETGRSEYMERVAEVIAAMQEKLPLYFNRLPEAELRIKRVEAFREDTETLAFYQPPSLDGRRPGVYYINLYDMTALPRIDLEALAFHEGIPGHHLEASLALELETLPDFQRFTPFVAFSEGWALYAEYLAKEMGFYQDPYAEFGRLAMELWRAARLVVDTGIHAKGWSREQAVAYLEQNTPNAHSDCRSAVERYVSWPGQATAYMVGKIRILTLREQAQEALGDEFDIREFHDTVLGSGPVPFDILDANILDMIERKKRRLH